MLLDRLPQREREALERNKEQYPSSYKAVIESLQKDTVLSLTLDEVSRLMSLADRETNFSFHTILMLFNDEEAK